MTREPTREEELVEALNAPGNFGKYEGRLAPATLGNNCVFVKCHRYECVGVRKTAQSHGFRVSSELEAESDYKILHLIRVTWV